MQNQQPGMAAAGYAATAVATRPSRFSLWDKIRISGAGVVAVIGGAIALVTYFKSQKNVLLFENSFEQAGELSLNGKSFGSIEPHRHLRLELDPGSYALSFSAVGQKLDEGNLVVPQGKGGIGTTGYRAVYNIGGQKGLGVVTKYYGGTFHDSVVPVEPGKRLIEMPSAELAKIDDGFPDSITVPKGASHGSVTHVCHIDEEQRTVGCPGW